MADLRTAAAETLGHLRSQQTLLENQKRNLQSITDQIRAKELRIVKLGEETTELALRIQQLTQSEASVSAQLTQLRQEIEPIEAQLSQLETQQAAQESKERDVQHTLRRDETGWNNAQLQWQRADDQLQQLHHEIEQDLGLVTLEESADVAYQPPLPWTAFVEQLPVLEALPAGLEEEVRATRTRLGRLSNINPDAPREYEEAAQRHGFLLTQSADLEAATTDLHKVLKELDGLMVTALDRTFKAVAEHFVRYFQQLFNGGDAQLILTEPDDLANTGIDIIARPPGKRN